LRQIERATAQVMALQGKGGVLAVSMPPFWVKSSGRELAVHTGHYHLLRSPYLRNDQALGQFEAWLMQQVKSNAI
jgi:hypothetical protein